MSLVRPLYGRFRPRDILSRVNVISGLPARFRLEHEVGRGGMAIVYRAHDTHLDRIVAIKVLSPTASTAIGIERFEREIALTARLAHPGIVALFDSGVADGRLYYVMPFVPGETLRARIHRERRLTMEEACTICADVADALAFAHAAGIVHRDVKPENIFVMSGRAMLADFGIARAAADIADENAVTQAGQSGLTTEGMVVGTVAYMSPEQAAGSAAIDRRSDLYSLGCVLFELLTGAPPFTGAPSDVLRQHLVTPPPSLTGMDVRATPALKQLLEQLLAKKPEERPSDATDVARTLRRASETGHASTPAPSTAEADRLMAEGVRTLRLGGAGGASARANLDQAEVYLKRALALEPRHARALCLYGNWHYVMSRLGFLLQPDADARGRELILAALAADDQIAEVHSSLAKMALYYDDDCHTAERHAARAVALDPRDPEVLRTHSIILKILGRADDAVTAAEAAVAMDPRLPSVLNALGDALRAAGRHAESLNALRRAVALQPTYGPALERMERQLAETGDAEGAADFRLVQLRASGEHDRIAQFERDIDEIGPAEARLRDLRREVDQLLTEAATTDPLAHHPAARSIADRIALLYSDLGEWANAVEWIEKAYAHNPGRLRRLIMDVPFDRNGLATQRRYVRLLRTAGLEDLLDRTSEAK
jgi:tetratricopeptide (TPR) repeat protein